MNPLDLAWSILKNIDDKLEESREERQKRVNSVVDNIVAYQKEQEMMRLLAQQQAQREGERAQKETLGTIDRKALDDAGGRDMIEESRRQAEEAEAAAAANKETFAERQKRLEEEHKVKLAELKQEQRRRQGR